MYIYTAAIGCLHQKFRVYQSKDHKNKDWIAAWAIGGVLPNFRKWSQLLSSLPTPAGSNLTLWSWQQLFWVVPSKKKSLVQIYMNIYEKFSTYTVFFILWSFDWYTRNFWCKHPIQRTQAFFFLLHWSKEYKRH